MKNYIVRSLSVAFLALSTMPADAQFQTWVRQFGTNDHDSACSAAPDGSGGVYVSGQTLVDCNC